MPNATILPAAVVAAVLLLAAASLVLAALRRRAKRHAYLTALAEAEAAAHRRMTAATFRAANHAENVAAGLETDGNADMTDPWGWSR